MTYNRLLFHNFTRLFFLPFLVVDISSDFGGGSAVIAVIVVVVVVVVSVVVTYTYFTANVGNIVKKSNHSTKMI